VIHTPACESKLIVARHGRTEWNATGRYQGHADIPLDTEGEIQAVTLAGAIAPLGPDRLVVSDLTRARQTMAPLAATTGLEPHVDPRLRELDVGKWEGLTSAVVRERFPDDFASWTAGGDRMGSGGETRADGARRAADAIVEHLEAAGAGRLVVVVSHGLVLRLAVDELRIRGIVDLPERAPSFDNAAWLEMVTSVRAG
jgi:broad specificity phosphatase PhoE